MSSELARSANPRLPSAMDTLESVLGKGMLDAFTALVGDPVWSVKLHEERRNVPKADERLLRLMAVADDLAALEQVHGKGAALSADDPFVMMLVKFGHVPQSEIDAARACLETSA